MYGSCSQLVPSLCPAFLQAFEKTGLGERIANLMVAHVGHSTLGLA